MPTKITKLADVKAEHATFMEYIKAKIVHEVDASGKKARFNNIEMMIPSITGSTKLIAAYAAKCMRSWDDEYETLYGDNVHHALMMDSHTKSWTVILGAGMSEDSFRAWCQSMIRNDRPLAKGWEKQAAAVEAALKTA
jgi:streptomycin 6-kinase